MSGILGKPGTCQGQAGTQDSVEGSPEVTLFSGHGSCAVSRGQPEDPVCPSEPLRPTLKPKLSE